MQGRPRALDRPGETGYGQRHTPPRAARRIVGETLALLTGVDATAACDLSELGQPGERREDPHLS